MKGLGVLFTEALQKLEHKIVMKYAMLSYSKGQKVGT